MRWWVLSGLVGLGSARLYGAGIAGAVGSLPLPCTSRALPVYILAGGGFLHPRGWEAWLGEHGGARRASCTMVGVFHSVVEEARRVAIVGEPAVFSGLAASLRRRRRMFLEGGYEDLFLALRLYILDGNVARDSALYAVWGLGQQVEAGGARGRCVSGFCGEFLVRLGLDPLNLYAYASGGFQTYGMLGDVMFGMQVVVNGTSFQLGLPPPTDLPHILLTPWSIHGFVKLVSPRS